MAYSELPKVSIVVPSYNRAHLIQRCLENLLCQTYGNFEIIVVDDGSLDDTSTKVSGITDPRVRYIKHDVNKGLAAARNTGIRAATGEFIAFQDTDDEWSKDKLSRQMEVFAGLAEEVGVVYGKALRFFNGREYAVPGKMIYPKEGDIGAKILENNFIAVISAIVRKSCFEKVGLFDESLPSLEDWELWIRMSREYKFKFMDEVLVKVSFTEDSLTANIHYTVEAREKILDKHLEWFSGSKRSLSKIYAQLGWDSCMMGDVKAGRQWIAKAMAVEPLEFKYYMIYIVSHLGVKAVRTVNDIYMGHKADQRA